jgi:hypothetical protein
MRQRLAQVVDVPPEMSGQTIERLHEQTIARTCSLNAGVCHNSREYPDLHTVSNLIAAIGRPCNVAALRAADVRDACEPVGDHLVIPSLAVDVEIATVDLSPVDEPAEGVTAATIALVDGAASGVASDVYVRRNSGGDSFDVALGDLGVTARIDGRSAVLDLSGAQSAARTFLDDRVYPWRETMVRVGDPNRNGMVGHTLGISLIEPGAPERSFLMMRLTDKSQGDLMPRQCRTWNQEATRVLGCWIRQLTVDDSGVPTNALEPIDLEACDYEPPAGQCDDMQTMP